MLVRQPIRNEGLKRLRTWNLFIAAAIGPAGTEKFVTKRPARYVILAYWSGIHLDLPVTLEVSTSPIK